MKALYNVPPELWLILLFTFFFGIIIYQFWLKKLKKSTRTIKSKLDPSLLDVHEELDYLIKSVHSASNLKNFQIKYFSTLDPNILIKGDKHHFQDALFDLVKNGLETSQNGTIEIAVHEMLSSILIVIENNGQNLTKKQIKGLCKSLPISGVIETMKGKIEVDSQQGKGTIFSVIIPKASDLKPNII